MRAGIVARRVGGAGIVAGSLYAAVGVAVGHTGFGKPGGPVMLMLMLVFVIGVLVAGLRHDGGVRPLPA